MNVNRITEISKVKKLLDEFSLPTSDLNEKDRLQLFGIFENDSLIACVGVETYGENGLLRSLAVTTGSREKQIGRRLCEYIESHCLQHGVKRLFLLTETADGYFTKLGYKIWQRDGAPAEIRGTTQFSDLCPSSSKFMMKNLES